jgi:hypothetical protein
MSARDSIANDILNCLTKATKKVVSEIQRRCPGMRTNDHKLPQLNYDLNTINQLCNGYISQGYVKEIIDYDVSTNISLDIIKKQYGGDLDSLLQRFITKTTTKLIYTCEQTNANVDLIFIDIINDAKKTHRAISELTAVRIDRETVFTKGPMIIPIILETINFMITDYNDTFWDFNANPNNRRSLTLLLITLAIILYKNPDVKDHVDIISPTCNSNILVYGEPYRISNLKKKQSDLSMRIEYKDYDGWCSIVGLALALCASNDEAHINAYYNFKNQVPGLSNVKSFIDADIKKHKQFFNLNATIILLIGTTNFNHIYSTSTVVFDPEHLGLDIISLGSSATIDYGGFNLDITAWESAHNIILEESIKTHWWKLATIYPNNNFAKYMRKAITERLNVLRKIKDINQELKVLKRLYKKLDKVYNNVIQLNSELIKKTIEIIDKYSTPDMQLDESNYKVNLITIYDSIFDNCEFEFKLGGIFGNSIINNNFTNLHIPLLLNVFLGKDDDIYDDGHSVLLIPDNSTPDQNYKYFLVDPNASSMSIRETLNNRVMSYTFKIIGNKFIISGNLLKCAARLFYELPSETFIFHNRFFHISIQPAFLSNYTTEDDILYDGISTVDLSTEEIKKHKPFLIGYDYNESLQEYTLKCYSEPYTNKLVLMNPNDDLPEFLKNYIHSVKNTTTIELLKIKPRTLQAKQYSDHANTTKTVTFHGNKFGFNSDGDILYLTSLIQHNTLDSSKSAFVLKDFKPNKTISSVLRLSANDPRCKMNGGCNIQLLIYNIIIFLIIIVTILVITLITILISYQFINIKYKKYV